MSPQEEARLLALLVHRGHLERADAEALLPALKAGRPLDELLVSELAWEEKKVLSPTFSAQQVSASTMFSMLQPVTTVPSDRRSAAPTA